MVSKGLSSINFERLLGFVQVCIKMRALTGVFHTALSISNSLASVFDI
jgi:hypothetical protein